MQTQTSRAQYAQGFCNEELELNICFLPWGDEINATDLAVFEHYPSGKWGTALVGDLLSSCFIRDPVSNLIRFLGGRDSGLLVEQQRSDLTYNIQPNGGLVIREFGLYTPNTIVTGNFGPVGYEGYWAIWYSNLSSVIKFGRIVTVNSEPEGT